MFKGDSKHCLEDQYGIIKCKEQSQKSAYGLEIVCIWIGHNNEGTRGSA